MFVPPCASVMTNGESVCQALSHNPSGFRPAVGRENLPFVQVAGMFDGIFVLLHRSLWQVLRKTVILFFFMSGVVLCSFGPGKAVV